MQIEGAVMCFHSNVGANECDEKDFVAIQHKK
jgi:hypothetical protein